MATVTKCDAAGCGEVLAEPTGAGFDLCPRCKRIAARRMADWLGDEEVQSYERVEQKSLDDALELDIAAKRKALESKALDEICARVAHRVGLTPVELRASIDKLMTDGQPKLDAVRTALREGKRAQRQGMVEARTPASIPMTDEQRAAVRQQQEDIEKRNAQASRARVERRAERARAKTKREEERKARSVEATKERERRRIERQNAIKARREAEAAKAEAAEK